MNSASPCKPEKKRYECTQRGSPCDCHVPCCILSKTTPWCWYTHMCTSLIVFQPKQTVVDCPGHLLTSRCPAEKRTINYSPVLDVRFSEVWVQSDQSNLSVADLQSPRCLTPHYKGQQRNCVRRERRPQGLTCRVINLTSKDFYSGSLRADQWGLIRFWPGLCVCVRMCVLNQV